MKIYNICTKHTFYIDFSRCLVPARQIFKLLINIKQTLKRMFAMKKIKQAFFPIIVVLSICTIMSCDSSSLKNDNDSLLMLAVASSDFTQIEFTILPDTMSWLDCTFTGIVVVGLGSFYTVTGTEGSETLVLNCGNGSVGYHNGSSTASSEYIKYTLDGNDYYGRTADGETLQYA